MKQFYYGNDYKNGGYGILACSEGIPGSIRSLMVKCAEEITETANGEFGLVFSGSSAVLYQNSVVLPRIELGENRKTYFSHQYYISGSQFDEFIKYMPEIIGGLKFVKEYGNSYDISDVQFKVTGGSTVRLPFGMAEAAKKALENDYRMVISGSGMNNQIMTGLMAALAEGFTLKERCRCGFMLCGRAKDKRLTGARFIFCESRLQYSLQAQLYNSCIYYDTDTEKTVYSADISPNKNVYEERSGMTDKESEKYVNLLDERGENYMTGSSDEYYTDDENLQAHLRNEKKPKGGSKSTAALVLGIIALIISCVSLSIAVFVYTIIADFEKEIKNSVSEREIISETEIITEPETGTEFSETVPKDENMHEDNGVYDNSFNDRGFNDHGAENFEESTADEGKNETETENTERESDYGGSIEDFLTDSYEPR